MANVHSYTRTTAVGKQRNNYNFALFLLWAARSANYANEFQSVYQIQRMLNESEWSRMAFGLSIATKSRTDTWPSLLCRHVAAQIDHWEDRPVEVKKKRKGQRWRRTDKDMSCLLHLIFVYEWWWLRCTCALCSHDSTANDSTSIRFVNINLIISQNQQPLRI